MYLTDVHCFGCIKYKNGCLGKDDGVGLCDDYIWKDDPNITNIIPEKIKEGSIKESDVKLSDMVNHPPHYTKGGIECLDAIRASMTDDEYKGYLKGNIIKYLWRYEWKNGLEDLKKAQFYQNRLIEIVQAEKVRGDSMHT